MLNTYEQNSRRKLIATIVAVVVIAGVVVVADGIKSGKFRDEIAEHTSTTSSTNSQPATATQTSASNSVNNVDASSASTASSYKDGTYSATSDYFVPHSSESIKVDVTLNSGTITDISIQNSEGDGDSAAYQEDFASVYKSYVVGKKISGLRLSTIAGASDTTSGFNNALVQIANKAQA